jgi:hypothetical protein
MEHNCKQEEKLGEMMALMKTIIKEYYGNGQEGISKTVPKLQGSVETLTMTIAAQTQVVADLVKFQASLKGVDEYKRERGLTSRQWVTIIITTIIGFSSMGCTLILHFKK